MTEQNAEDILRRTPAIIRQLDLDLFKHKRGLDGLRLRLRLREADVGQQIAKENAETKAYPNADARSDELRKRVEHDAEARAVKKEIVDEEAVVARMVAVIDYHRDAQRNARVLVLARSPATILFDDPEIAL